MGEWPFKEHFNLVATDCTLCYSCLKQLDQDQSESSWSRTGHHTEDPGLPIEHQVIPLVPPCSYVTASTRDFLNSTASITAAESRPHHPTQNNFLGGSQVSPHLILRATPLSNGLPVDRNDLIEATTAFLCLGTHSVLARDSLLKTIWGDVYSAYTVCASIQTLLYSLIIHNTLQKCKKKVTFTGVWRRSGCSNVGG